MVREDFSAAEVFGLIPVGSGGTNSAQWTAIQVHCWPLENPEAGNGPATWRTCGKLRPENGSGEEMKLKSAGANI